MAPKFLDKPFYRDLIFYLFAIGCFLYSFILHYHGLSTPSYWDDGSLIFQNAHILEGRNPIDYWLRGNPETKAWPLTHTLYWLEYRIFGADTFYYRLTNLGLHWLIGLLTGLFVQRWGGNRWIAALIVWFHPSNIEAVAWISQISTLLTGLFLLGWMQTLLLGLRLGQEFIFLFLMLASKGYAYLLPIISLRSLLKRGSKTAFLAGLFLLCITGYYIFLAAVGVGSTKGELRFSTKYLEERGDPKRHLTLGQMEKENQELLSKAPMQSADASLSQGFFYFYSLFVPQTTDRPIPQTEFWYRKIHIVGETASFYLKQFFLPVENAPRYSPGALSSFYFSIGLLVLAGLALVLFFRSKLSLIVYLTYLPISGLVYVPYMKFSLVADRYSYIPYLVMAWIIAVKAGQRRWLRELCFAWVVFLIFRYHGYVSQFYERQVPLF